ncbi:MAG: arylsulfotransferase family protein [Pseudomonadota bacterium]
MSSSSEKPDAAGNETGDRIFFAVFVAGLAGLSFIAGALIILSETPPYRYLRDAWTGGKALWEQQTKYTSVERLDFWAPQRNDKTGVTRHDPDRAQSGLTLYSSGDGPHAVLVDMEGNIVHEWRAPFSAFYDEETSPIKNPQRDEFMHWHTAKMLPDGDIVVQYTAAGDTPYGYGLARLDRESNVVWGYLGEAHHDFSFDEAGFVYALTHEFRFNEYKDRDPLRTPRLDDFAVQLSPEGKELKRVSILDALLESSYAHYLDFVPWFSADDVLHTNTIEVIDAARAAVFPHGKEGDVLLSFRDMGVIAVLDMDAEKIVWATRGPWFGQHDPDILENGDILLFDNQGQMADPDAGQSRVIQIDPITNAITWEYRGTADDPFDSDIRADQERLPNGNTLMTESSGGRLLEVTADGDVVWEYYNPIRRDDPEKPGTRLIPVVSQAERISDDRMRLFVPDNTGENP